MTNSNNELRRQVTAAFTLIEILIVVIIIGVLTSIVVPQFGGGTRTPRDATLKDCLRYLRTQIQVYRTQHGDIAPGYPGDDASQAPDATTFVAQMTQFSDAEGRVSSARSRTYGFGPYLSDMPANPISSQNGILVVGGSKIPVPDPSQPYGWIYVPQTQQIIPNLSGADEEGVPYASY